MILAASPFPVTRPIRAHMDWTAAINGNASGIVHSMSRPNCAPAWEYVAMPLGSSSATPVISPGPTRARGCSFKRVQSRRKGFARGDPWTPSWERCIGVTGPDGFRLLSRRLRATRSYLQFQPSHGSVTVATARHSSTSSRVNAAVTAVEGRRRVTSPSALPGSETGVGCFAVAQPAIVTVRR